MKTECIECHKTWGEDDKDGIKSSGLCKECGRKLMGDLIRRKQRRDGHLDCFGTANGSCNQMDCKYRSVCV